MGVDPVKNPVLKAAMVAIAVAGTSGAAAASEILVTSDIATSTTWTSDNTYNLQQQIYVLPGATLTIQAGTIVASDTNIGGSLAVCKGAQIFVQGTRTNPVIMTSKADVATWTGGDPKTGTWREAANEWGNLTVMGSAYISENAIAGNVATPDANNVGAMEGLIAGFPGDTKVLYGGGDDDDDSGTITYVSLRYGGKVVSLANELNGLSMGGIGRGTTVHHVDIMNNVDDGIETWGGTVNYKYVNIWNVGDDSMDTDQGWRGKAQFGLIVQGYSVDAVRGSGVGDNCFEMDGAEDSDWQPVSTNTLYNFTAIGQPLSARKGVAFRDNDRSQFRNCIFMDLAQEVVKNDGSDGDGAHGYGFNGTLDFPTTWATDYSVFSTVNAPANPADFYKAQTSGKLCEVRDTVYFRNLFSSGGTDAYTTANSVNVFDLANNNVLIPGFNDVDSPITALSRGPAVTRGGQTLLPVTFLDPRPQHEALSSVDWATEDGFYTSARYRGAFAPGNTWLHGWTACEAFGFTAKDPWSDLGFAKSGTTGAPVLSGSGDMVAPNTVTFSLTNALPSTPAFLVIGFAEQDLPFKGGVLVPSFNLMLSLATNGAGGITLSGPMPGGVPSGTNLYFQYLIVDAGGFHGMSFSNGLLATTP
jgi:hypothetical protein